MEKREPLYTVGAATTKSSIESLQKIKNNTTIGHSFSTSVYLSKEYGGALEIHASQGSLSWKYRYLRQGEKGYCSFLCKLHCW